MFKLQLSTQKMLNAVLILQYKNNETKLAYRSFIFDKIIDSKMNISTFGNFEMHIFYPPAKDVFKVPSNNPSNSNCSSLAILYFENNKTYAEESPLSNMKCKSSIPTESYIYLNLQKLRLLIYLTWYQRMFPDLHHTSSYSTQTVHKMNKSEYAMAACKY
ncbi:hypothetical protein T11_5410 [Trichinella zimbabwensis]|uniref:Uncharacterized protein n=1 Tax=Trichinella zimbabwensis TaxID=268475 RepID=A0A0V1I6P7_9BILA|nr:hypothetical protein T11_5410 [Trichinella zimbabwensis]